MSLCTVMAFVGFYGLCFGAAPKTVGLFGDSLIAYQAEFSSVTRNDSPVYVPNAIPGIGLADVRAYWVPRIQALKAQGIELDEVHVTLGSNDVRRCGTAPGGNCMDVLTSYPALIDLFVGAIQEAWPGALVKWITPGKLPAAGFPLLPRVVITYRLFEAQARWPGVLAVVYPNSTDTCGPTCFAVDGVHLSPEGARRYRVALEAAQPLP